MPVQWPPPPRWSSFLESQTDRLFAIAAELQARATSASPELVAQLTGVVDSGNRLIEAVDLLLSATSRPHDEVLKPAVEEVFVDLHVAATLAMGGQYKSAGVILRTTIETSLFVLYFLDHPIEARMWANQGSDMSFRVTLETMTKAHYIAAASGVEPDDALLRLAKETLSATYRSLSERVHGKHAFLNVTGDAKDRLFHFCRLGSDALDGISLLAVLRLGAAAPGVEDSPSLKRLIDRWLTQTKT